MWIIYSSNNISGRFAAVRIVLTSSQDIRDLIKGVCIMERQVMFTQCLLVLMMTLHDTSACQCAGGMLRWENIMCPSRDKTVVEGMVIGGQLMETLRNSDDPEDFLLHGGYTMHLEKIFKNGSNPLRVRNGTFFVVLPNSETDCGRPLFGARTYIISGTVLEDGVLYSNMCQYIAFSTDVSICSPEMDILLGRKELNC